MDTNISGIPSKDLFIDQNDIKHNNTNSIDIVVINNYCFIVNIKLSFKLSLHNFSFIIFILKYGCNSSFIFKL